MTANKPEGKPSPGLANMFGRLIPCPHCEGSGCDPCGFTGFPAGRIPRSVKAQLAAEGFDIEVLADDVRAASVALADGLPKVSSDG